jgi:ERCC4-type nuclease
VDQHLRSKGGVNIKHYYTEKEYKELLSHLVILHNSREKTSTHILDYLDSQNIKHKTKALKTGDYSFMIESCPSLGFVRDTYYDDLCIERKNSVSEIAGNFCEKDDRFLKELNRMTNIKNVYLLIEDDSLQDVLDGNYKSKLNELSLLRSILTVQKRSGFYLYFVQKESMGKMIYEICKNCLDNTILK